MIQCSFLPFSRQYLEQGVQNQAGRYAVGNAVGKGHEDDGHEKLEAFTEIRKVDALDLFHHEHADDNQDRRGRRFWMRPMTGAKMRDRMKQRPQVTAVKPVLPPAPTPAALSTKAVMVLVPRREPRLTPQASTKKARPRPGNLPDSGSRMPRFRRSRTDHGSQWSQTIPQR